MIKKQLILLSNNYCTGSFKLTNVMFCLFGCTAMSNFNVDNTATPSSSAHQFQVSSQFPDKETKDLLFGLKYDMTSVEV